VNPPGEDIDDRALIWNQMQMFWMDTDPGIFLPEIARACAESKYSIDELKAIFWNEVRPAVAFNLWMLPAPEWTGFELEWLKGRVLKKARFGRPVRLTWLSPYAADWWRKLNQAILSERNRATVV
jgi:hypothetical protein